MDKCDDPGPDVNEDEGIPKAGAIVDSRIFDALKSGSGAPLLPLLVSS